MFGMIYDGIASASNLYNPLDEDYQRRKQQEEQASLMPTPGPTVSEDINDPNSPNSPLNPQYHQTQMAQEAEAQTQQGEQQRITDQARSNVTDPSQTLTRLTDGGFTDKYGNHYTDEDLKTLSPQQQQEIAMQKVDKVTENKHRYSVSDDLDTDEGKFSGFLKVAGAMGMAALVMGTGGLALPAMVLHGFKTSRDLEAAHGRTRQIGNLEREGHTRSSIQTYLDTGDRSALVKDTMQQIKDGNFTKTIGASTGMQYGQSVANEVQLQDPVTGRMYIQRGDTLIDSTTNQPVTGVDVSKLLTVENVAYGDERSDKAEQQRIAQSGDARGWAGLSLQEREFEYRKEKDAADREAKEAAKLNAPAKLSAFGEKTVENLHSESQSDFDTAERFDAKAKQIEAQKDNWSTGWFGDAKERFADVMGTQDEVSALRKDYQEIRNSEVIKTMPPGPASDNDVKIFSSGFPESNWPAEKLAAWMRGKAKVSRYNSEMKARDAEYYQRNGGRGKDVSTGKTYTETQREWRTEIDRQYKDRYGDTAKTSIPAPKGARDGHVIRNKKTGKTYLVKGGVLVEQ